MINSKKLILLFILLSIQTSTLIATTHTDKTQQLDIKKLIKEHNKLKDIADKVTDLNLKDLKNLQFLIDNKYKEDSQHKHHETKKSQDSKVIIRTDEDTVVPQTKESLKLENILNQLSTLAKEKTTKKACTFCSAILDDIEDKSVKIIDIDKESITLRIKKGDTLSGFAKHYYGDANVYKRIAAYKNNGIGKNLVIYEGKNLNIPRINKQKKLLQACQLCTNILHNISEKDILIVAKNNEWIDIKIKKGDTLSHLALEHYNDESLYPKIYNANRGKIAKNYLIYIGDILKIPSP